MVIQDIRMEHPESGWHILDKLRRGPVTQYIPVLIVSSEPDVSQTATEFQLERCEVLPAPLDPQVLLQKVEVLVEHYERELLPFP